MKKKKQIVFIEGYNTVMVYKIARLFQKKGYETLLIRILAQTKMDTDFYNQAFNKVIDLNLNYHEISKKNLLKILCSNLKNMSNLIFSFIKILNLKPYVVIGRSRLNMPIAFFIKVFKKTPFIYFPYDITCQIYETLDSAKKHIPILEIKAEKFCFENCDGIIHKGAPNELDYLNGRMLGNIKLPKHQIMISPYCLKEFIIPLNKDKLSKKDKEVHCVYVGGGGQQTVEKYFAQFHSYIKLIKQKIHFHNYYCSTISSEKEAHKSELIKNAFKKKYKNYPGINYVHLEDSKDPKEIIKEISKYDFGLSPYIPEDQELESKLGMGNKFATYLEAGIPAFYRNDNLWLNKLRAEYDLDLNWENMDMENLNKEIKKLNYKQLEKNILKMRTDFLMEKHFPRLEEFIKEVEKSKKLKIK